MNPLHRAALADRGAEPSPARPQAAAFELPAELRAASPSTSDIVVLGLECWEGARPADPTARFREFCIAALCLPARLFLHVPIACIAKRSARDARRSFCQLRLPAAAATAILAARRRLHGAHCPVSLDVPRTREEQVALWSLRSQMSGGRADQPPSRADASPSWRAEGATAEPRGIAPAPAPSASAPAPAPAAAFVHARAPRAPALPAALPAPAPASMPAPASTPAHTPVAAPPAPPLAPAPAAVDTVVDILATEGRGKAVRYHARVIAAGVEGDRWLTSTEIPPAVLAAWRRQRRRDQCRACRQRQSASQPTASQQRQPPPHVQQSASQQRQPPAPTDGARRSLRLAAPA